jgi:putative membrane protein
MLLLSVLVNVQNLLASVVYALVGLVVFVLGLWVFRLIMPFDVRKEIEVDQNVSLGIVIGSFIIGLALIVSAAITG